jgi:hypothetical protein
VAEGKDVNEPKEWFQHHLKSCINPFIDARECQVDKKVEVVRKMKTILSDEQWEEFQKRMRYQAYVTRGVDKWDKLWNPDLDFTDYFKKYRAHMLNIQKLEEDLAKEIATTGDISDPNKYMPKKFWNDTQVYFDDSK